MDFQLATSNDELSRPIERPLTPADVADPCGFLKDHLHFKYTQSQNESNTQMAAWHGTTCLSFIYNGGIIVAVDSRATGGSFIFSGSVMKIIEICPTMVGTMAGGAADCQYWVRQLARIYRLHKFRFQQPLTVAAASKILVNQLYQYKGYGLSIASMICGYDHTGPHIFYVGDDGTRIPGKRFSVGSGSTFAYGVLDTSYREDLTKEEAVELGKRAIWNATFRDAGSGGRVTVVHITEAGVEWVSRTDVVDLAGYQPEV
jgi:20S proteasome subunit beta 5